jgi:hypothetical protein
MTDLPAANECRQRALLFAKYSAACASPEARARFVSIAENWTALASELEQRQALDVGGRRQRSG